MSEEREALEATVGAALDAWCREKIGGQTLPETVTEAILAAGWRKPPAGAARTRPDAGGKPGAMAELNTAIADAREELKP